VASSARIARDVGWSAQRNLTDMVRDAYAVQRARTR
jgi:UDP-glucose 4-epimerase